MIDIEDNLELIKNELWYGCFDDRTEWSLDDFQRLLSAFRDAAPDGTRHTIRVIAEYERGRYDAGDAARLWIVRSESEQERMAREGASGAHRL